MKAKNAKVLFSNVCRVTSQELADIAAPGIVPIPMESLPPREVQVNAGVKFSVTLKPHREKQKNLPLQYLPVIDREDAKRMVSAGDAVWLEQSLLSNTREEYLSDPDVIEDREEFDRIRKSDCTLVVVAVIGGTRSSLTVCRNIATGCQNKEKLVSDATKALGKTNIFLVE